MATDDLLNELVSALKQEQRDIPSVIDAFNASVETTFPPQRCGELLEAAKAAFKAGGAAPQLPVAPTINLRWGLPDGSQEAWFLTVRDDDDAEGEAFFTIRLKPETAGLIAAWCLHIQRIRVPGTKAPEPAAKA